MMKNILKIAQISVASLLLLSGASLAQSGGCLSAADIQNAVSSGQILSLDQIVSSAGLSKSEVVGRFKVCPKGGALFYELPVLSGGEAKTLVLNANTGRP